jgi:hypothetical protein
LNVIAETARQRRQADRIAKLRQPGKLLLLVTALFDRVEKLGDRLRELVLDGGLEFTLVLVEVLRQEFGLGGIDAIEFSPVGRP